MLRILAIKASNFGSYKELSFNLENRGLTIIQGPTGSGKSTICDVVAWTLFGKTVKGGSVDEVLSWGAQLPTSSEVTLETSGKHYKINRIRGNHKDLYFNEINTELEIRGKDIMDTQKLINKLLGLDFELYLSAGYFHEFSSSAAFFTTTAKNRREMCEQLVDLTLAITLQECTGEQSKILRSKAEKAKNNYVTMDAHRTYIDSRRGDALYEFNNFDRQKEIKLLDLQNKADNFDANQADNIVSLIAKRDEFESKREEYIIKHTSTSPTCEACGSILSNNHKHKIQTENQLLLKKQEINPYDFQIKQAKSYKNNYKEQIEDLKKSTNPHEKLLLELQEEAEKTGELLVYHKQVADKCSKELLDFELLSDIVVEFRAALISRTISEVQTRINSLLEIYFDSEFIVELSVQNTDKVEANISKNGNSCVYTQLSKGQRQLLKLCFGISVMQVIQNHHGVKLNCLWFDEALDGMSDALKIKSFPMFQALEKEFESVFVVDHSETFKLMFDNKIEVSLEGNHSVINET